MISAHRWLAWGTLLLLAIVFMQCNPTGPSQNLEPLLYRGPNPNFAETYYLDPDSLVSLIPELTLVPTGSSQTDGLLMKLHIAVTVTNQSQQPDTLVGGRATVYIHNDTRPVATVMLNPGENTIDEREVKPGELFVCNYVNDPLDEIPYDPLQTEYFAVFTLMVNTEERIFVTQIAQPGD